MSDIVPSPLLQRFLINHYRKLNKVQIGSVYTLVSSNVYQMLKFMICITYNKSWTLYTELVFQLYFETERGQPSQFPSIYCSFLSAHYFPGFSELHARHGAHVQLPRCQELDCSGVIHAFVFPTASKYIGNLIDGVGEGGRGGSGACDRDSVSRWFGRLSH